VDAVRAAAARAGCTILYKGPDTVIADPDGQCMINVGTGARAAPWLATAGSGDVLSGFIAGLLARGFAPGQAAATAAWLHVECARSIGPGLVSEDLPDALRVVFRSLGL
jgi:ADP-dependent NAD(P)H-hydrate dehydratase / NAD(P)H-hydrate epimerase